ncbi:MAG: 50S ribosomal protein L37e [Nitrososphaeria archaeon]
MKGTPSMGKRKHRILHGFCRRCGKKSYNLVKHYCAHCGYGRSARWRSYSFLK